MSCAGSETAAPVRAEPPPTSSPEPSLSDDQSDASAPLAAPTAQPTPPTAQPAPATPQPEPTTQPTAEPAAVSPRPAPTAPAPTAPAPVGPSAQTVVLQEANPRVTGVVYPRPDYDGDPWSQWGPIHGHSGVRAWSCPTAESSRQSAITSAVAATRSFSSSTRQPGL